MSQPITNSNIPESEDCPNIQAIVAMARQHFVALHGREPRQDECLFDQEPPSEWWTPAVLSCELLLKEVQP